MEQSLFAARSILSGIFICVAWLWLSNRALDWLCARRAPRAAVIRPWLFLAPALAALTLYLIYPILASILLSVQDARAERFVGLANYRWLAQDAKFIESLRNTAFWLMIVPAATTALGLLAAALIDRIGWGALAKSLIFMPMAISFVGASVVWKFVYEFRAEGPQIGLLNAAVVALGGQAQTWLTQPVWNSLCLMAVVIWLQTGFAMVILAAALRAIPEETVEAAMLDGASPWQIFSRIKLPQIWGTVAVVWTTITVTVLKLFDIVLTMTNGQWGTQVLAGLMFDWMFRANDAGRASVVALVIMALVTPIMVWNIRQMRKEMR